MFPSALLQAATLAGDPVTGRSSHLELLAYELGSHLGTALYCREPTAEAFARRAAARLRIRASGKAQWAGAVRVLADAAGLRAVHGPITETCGQFHVRYRRTLHRLDPDRGPKGRPRGGT